MKAVVTDKWILCPVCGAKTRTQILDDTELKHFPLFCPKCKKSFIINVKDHIENLMNFALGIKLLGVKHMDFKAFDRSKLDEYSRQAKELYGNTPEYKEMEEKQKNRTEEDEKILADRFMLFFKEAGEMKNMNPASDDAQNLVRRLQDYITQNLYTCTNKILRGLGKMYSGGGDFTTNIDAYGGEGTAIFVADAIEIYCDNAE